MSDSQVIIFRTLLDWLSMQRNQPFSLILNLLDLCNFFISSVHPCILPVYLSVSFLYH